MFFRAWRSASIYGRAFEHWCSTGWEEHHLVSTTTTTKPLTCQSSSPKQVGQPRTGHRTDGSDWLTAMRARCRCPRRHRTGTGDCDHNSATRRRCWPLEFWTCRSLVLEATIPTESPSSSLVWIWVLLAVSGVQVQVKHGGA